MPLNIETPFTPKGDQPKAIEQLVEGIKKGYKLQTLLGTTGSGKTDSIAWVIDRLKLPTLVIAPNKTLAAQLYGEFKVLFPSARVEYFVSFYDYYQPEAYLPSKDLLIEKDFDINEEIERLRHSATEALATRDDVIVVASVSCIYGIGDPAIYRAKRLELVVGQEFDREELMTQLINNRYERNDINLTRGKFRVRGDTIDIFPQYGDYIYRVEFFGDEIERLTSRDPVTYNQVREFQELTFYPGTHYLTRDNLFDQALADIEQELEERLAELKSQGKLVEYQRLKQRTKYDLELLRETKYCPGIENYSRHLDRRKKGEPPYTLMDHMPDDFLLVIDESHLTIPQIKGMFGGDYSRKKNLVDYGFRLPSAFDNRPLKFDEFKKYMKKVIFTSATPGPYEIEHSEQIVEQIIRPTGLVDPKIEVRKTEGQIDDLLGEIKKQVRKGGRVLVTTLTKDNAEMLSDYLIDNGINSVYLHHEVDTLDRINILRDLRIGKYDVIVGINLLREGLDLPEVGLVAILDADKEGFLRSKSSLIQLMGRASRNVSGSVILYADKITDSMKEAIFENNRRRRIQIEYNRKHGINPQTIKKEVKSIVETLMQVSQKEEEEEITIDRSELTVEKIMAIINELKEKMAEAAANLEFEKAAIYRDKIREIEKQVDTK
ncbi:MAG: excinuclease ABC subunit UvrB [Candidatus Heimdallarchaeum aukensis]|uniref:UvrABC system protein B n=1 Tax=Candidatus Heimdallarchaeum aukensis TaxID=2876573 RepID=A0A9Y1BJ93_9ARCH|nr:MAG: excinuclease ABC subunit UvrB [Candidatus Heimdallarchaeum aukensis]